MAGLLDALLRRGGILGEAPIVPGILSDVDRSLAANNYNTPLSPKDMAAYDAWIAAQSKATGRDMTRDTEDYDMRGWFKQNGPQDLQAGAHFNDTYKKPTHPTFSNESMYSGVAGNEGGQWGRDQGPMALDTFTPGPTNFRNWDMRDLLDYFSRYEPGNRLILPGGR